MRRFTTTFIVALLVLLLASVAGAAPPSCSDNPDHPQCTTTTEPSSTTTTTEPTLQACPTGTWTVSGIRRTIFECLWKPAVEEGADVAYVTISNIDGGVRRPPVLFVRDDAPGDLCLLEQEWATQNGPEYVASFDLFYDEVPVPTDQDPDVLDYSAWLGQSYWDFVYDSEAEAPGNEPGTHWCAPQDYVLWGIREDNNGGALVLTVSFDAKRGGSLDITLSPENSP